MSLKQRLLLTDTPGLICHAVSVQIAKQASWKSPRIIQSLDKVAPRIVDTSITIVRPKISSPPEEVTYPMCSRRYQPILSRRNLRDLEVRLPSYAPSFGPQLTISVET